MLTVFAILPENQIQFPAPELSGLQCSVSLSPKNAKPSSGPLGQLHSHAHPLIHSQTHAYN